MLRGLRVAPTYKSDWSSFMPFLRRDDRYLRDFWLALHRLPASAVRKDTNMDSGTWNHFILLRPLIVFLIACPALIAPALIAWIKERRDEKRRVEAEARREATLFGGVAGTRVTRSRCESTRHVNGAPKAQAAKTKRAA